MVRSTSVPAAVATAVICVLASTSRAQADGERIVVEAYEGERPSDAATLLAPVYNELRNRAYVLGQPLVSELNGRVSRDGGVLTASQIVDAERQVESAFQHFIDGDYARALAQAQTAIATYDAAPAQLARESALRDLRYKALLIAARSAEVQGHQQDAFALMAEVIRSFPDRPVASSQFDPKVSALYHSVKEELDRQGTCSLEVKVDDSTATVFVDEQFAGAGGAKLGPIAPGHYRIYVAKGQEPGRVHLIDCQPGGLASTSIS